MIRGLPASIIAHAAVLSASYFTWPYWGGNSSAYIATFEAVDVNFAEIGEVTNIAPLIAQEPEEDTEETAPEEPEEVPEDEPVDEDIPEAEQDVGKIDEPEPAEEDPEDVLPDFEQDEEEADEPEPTKDPDPTPKPPADPLSDFLNQSETTFKSEIETQRKRPDPAPELPADEPKTALENAPKPVETRNRRGAGERNGNTARLEAFIDSRIRNECWSGVDDLPNPEQYNVQMKLLLNENGTIADLSLVSPKRRPIGSSYMGTAVDRAMRAVSKCAPYRLPRDEYELWKEVDIYLGLGYASRKQ